MEIYISYFYQVRNFPPYSFPLSTACGDPLWFHQGTRDKTIQFFDKRNVLNGARIQELVPDASCGGWCPCDYHKQGPPHNERCMFLKQYAEQLNKLNFDKFLERLIHRAESFQEFIKSDRLYPILLVHEAPNNPCSERWVLKDWFIKHGYLLSEWGAV